MRSRYGGAYGEIIPRGQPNLDGLKTDENPVPEAGEGEIAHSGRTRQSVLRNGTAVKARPGKHIEGYNALDEMEDESDASSSGAEWDGGDDDDDVDAHVVDEEDDEDADMSDDESSIADEEEAIPAEVARPRGSLVVALRYHKTDDAPFRPPNVQEQSPTALVSNPQLLSPASRLAPDSDSPSRLEKSPEQEQTNPASISPMDLIESPLSQKQTKTDYSSGSQLTSLAATNQ